MVEKLDGTIDCINNVFKEVVPAKPERVTRNFKSPHEKVRKEKTYAYVEYDQYVFYLEGGQLKKFPVTGQGFEWTHGFVHFHYCIFRVKNVNTMYQHVEYEKHREKVKLRGKDRNQL